MRKVNGEGRRRGGAGKRLLPGIEERITAENAANTKNATGGDVGAREGDTFQVVVGPACRECGCKQAEVIEKKRSGDVEYGKRRCAYCGSEYTVETREGGELDLSGLEVRKRECPSCRERGIYVTSTKTIGNVVERWWKCPNTLCNQTFKTHQGKE